MRACACPCCCWCSTSMGKSHVLQRNDGYNERYQRIEKFHIFISVRFSDCDWIFSTYARIERNKNKCYIKQIYIVAGAMCWCIIEINSSHNSKMFYASAFLHELWDKIMSEPATKQANSACYVCRMKKCSAKNGNKINAFICELFLPYICNFREY